MDSEHCHRREVLSGFTTRQDRLFPGLTQHTSGRYSDALSKKFARHLRDTGLKDAGLSFHSLRHTFTHKFKVAAPRDAETRERLLGHAVAGVAGRYGKSFAAEAADMQLLEERARTLALIEF
jgi:integrase